jgi:hypothetical protein
MAAEQTPACRSRSPRTAAALLAFLAAAVVGSMILAWPFVHSAPPWQWELREQGDLTAATTNAELISIDSRGALLGRQGQRGISIITPLLKLPADSNRVLMIWACRPEVSAGEQVPTVVRLLWQTEPAAGYHFESQASFLDSRPRKIVFSLPEPPEKLYRLGVQFPDVRDTVMVSSFSLPSLPPAARIRLAWKQVNADEPISNSSVNFIRGPRILGHTFNYYLVSAVLGAVGVYGFLCVVRFRRVLPQIIFGIALVAWVVADGQATNNLARQAGMEMDELRGKSWPEQLAAMHGQEIAWAYAQLLQLSPAGSRFAVVSDDPFGPSRRLAYLLAPERTWRESCEEADFVVVVRAGEAAFDSPHRLFQWKGHPSIPAEKIAELSPDVYLLRRVAP